MPEPWARPPAICTSSCAPASIPIFKRDGDDIHLTVPVTLTEAALGAKVEVPTIDGRALLRIPPGTQCGQKLRLREKGVPSAVNEGQRGDEIVEIQTVTPKVDRRALEGDSARAGKAESGGSASRVVDKIGK